MDQLILATMGNFELRRVQSDLDLVMITYKGDSKLTEAGYDEGMKMIELYEMSPRGSC